jgi:hypothetical protein
MLSKITWPTPLPELAKTKRTADKPDKKCRVFEYEITSVLIPFREQPLQLKVHEKWTATGNL